MAVSITTPQSLFKLDQMCKAALERPSGAKVRFKSKKEALNFRQRLYSTRSQAHRGIIDIDYAQNLLAVTIKVIEQPDGVCFIHLFDQASTFDDLEVENEKGEFVTLGELQKDLPKSDLPNPPKIYKVRPVLELTLDDINSIASSTAGVSIPQEGGKKEQSDFVQEVAAEYRAKTPGFKPTEEDINKIYAEASLRYENYIASMKELLHTSIKELLQTP